MMEAAKYSTLKSADSVVLYLDECERKDIIGQPSYGFFDWMIQVFVFLVWLISLPVTWCFSFKVIPQFERVVIFRLGRVRSLKGPGLISIIPFADTWKRVDMRMRAFKVPPQEVITLDHALIKLGADVQYRISDPIATHTLIQDIDHCLRVTGQSVLTSQLSLNTLSDMQNNKVSLQQTLQLHMNKTVGEWGIEIARFELSTYVILKNPGGIEPVGKEEADDCGGGAMIMDLIKSFTSGNAMMPQFPGSSIQLPGMMPANLSPATLPLSHTNNNTPKPPPSGAQKVPLMTPDELFSLAKGVIDEPLCQQVNAVFEFHVNDGLQNNIWSVDLLNAPGCVMVGEYKRGPVDVRFTLSLSDFQKLFYGILKPTEAYMQGSLKIDGSVQTAKKLEYLIRKMQQLST